MIAFSAQEGKPCRHKCISVMGLETHSSQVGLTLGCQALLHLHHPVLSLNQPYGVGMTLIFLVKLRLKMTK